MLSIHYHALGDRLEVRGSPAVLVRPEVEPMPLDEALHLVYDTDRSRLRPAVWALIRSVPAPRTTDDHKRDALARRYGPEFEDFIAQTCLFDLAKFDNARLACRREARLFSAALVAYPQELTPTIDTYMTEISNKKRNPFTDATRATGILGGITPAEFLAHIDGLENKDLTDKKPGRRKVPQPDSRQACAAALERLENEVAVSIDTYIGSFADTVAFMNLCRDTDLWNQEQAVTVFPAFCVATQDAATLTTTVTATALVKPKDPKDFLCLTRAIDPRNWRDLSDRFHNVRFVADDGLDLTGDTLNAEIGHGLPKRRKPYLVEEKVGVVSDVLGTEIGSFHNVLRIRDFTVNTGPEPANCYADLDFSLYRSVGSEVLWDRRPGGLLIDSGWTRIRHVSQGVWRMTSCKILRFADRTPNSSWDGPLDFGQMLNYLAPAAVSAWLENDLYVTESPDVHRERKAEVL
jgi:hypothetical protein